MDENIGESFQIERVVITRIDLRPGARLPGGKRAISQAIIAELVKGSRQPILVRPLGTRYELVAGDLDYWVARHKGESTIICWIKKMDEVTAIITRISEGAKRKDINPVEEAEIIYELVHEHGISHQEIAIRTGRKQCTISNKLRLLRLPKAVLDGLRNGEIGERQARALLRVTQLNKQLELFRRCVKMRLTAEQMEGLCRVTVKEPLNKSLLRANKRRIIYKDPRIFQNTLRKVAVEMKKAGLDVVYKEVVEEKSWEFKVLVRT